MPFADRLKSAFREAPWCTGIALVSLVVWLLSFFGVGAPMQILGGELNVPHAWRWLTYPLANPVPASGSLWFFIGLIFFVLFLADLERSWGSLRFVRVFLMFTLAAACTEWLAYAVSAKAGTLMGAVPPQVWSMRVPAAALFMVWFALNQEATIMFMLVLPIKAKYLAIVDVVLMFFDDRGPIFGSAAALVLIIAWYWALRYGSAGTVTRSSTSRRPSLSSWWNDRRKAKRKGRFQVLEGGSTLPSERPKVGTLQSLKKAPPPPKVDEPNQKELDRILDKIRFEGMGALTEAEKTTLDSQSRRLRGDA